MDQIEEVRRKTDIVSLISQYVTLKKSGRNFKALCPFHEEKSPSFMVSQERQIFKCFGCQAGGDCYSFVMRKEGLEFGEALRLLAEKAGVELKQFQPTEGQKLKEKLLEVNHLSSEYFHYLLTEHKSGTKALQYLLKRGISKASIKAYKLGYSPEEWEGLIQYLHQKKGYKLTDIEASGLAIKGNRGYYDRFRGRVMFTLFDLRNRVVGFAGRTMDPEAKEAKYINSPETEIYHKSSVLYGLNTTKEEIKRANKAVVVEGELDAISSYQAGVKNVVAIKGSALTEEQIDLLKRFTDNLALALDADAAGDMAARRGIELAENAGMSVRVIKLKYGKDPDECAQHSAKLWKESVKEATPIYDYLIDSAVNRFETKTPEGKRQISEEVAKALATIQNQVVKAHYVKKLAEILSVSEEAVGLEVDRQGRSLPATKTQSPASTRTAQNRAERLENYILALIIQSEDQLTKLLPQVDTGQFGQGAVKKVFSKLISWLKNNKKWQVNLFVKDLAAELVEVIDVALLTELGFKLEDDIKLKTELEVAVEELRSLKLKEQLTIISAQIKKAEADKDRQKATKLQQQFVSLRQQIQDRH
jgi:DNA primase